MRHEQPAIVDRKLFDAVQAKLSEQATNQRAKRTMNDALLTGRIFDDRGNRMSPSHTRKAGRRYRYYLSSALFQGRSNEAGSVRRVPAPEIETIVVEALRTHLNTSGQFDDRGLVNEHVERIEVQPGRIALKLVSESGDYTQGRVEARTLHVPWCKQPMKRGREILVPNDTEPRRVRPLRDARNARGLDRARTPLAR